MLSDLQRRLSDPALSRSAFIGLDGFIDEIIHVVDKRYSPSSYERMKKIQDYATRISRARAMNTNIELVSLTTKMGGNGPILANVLLHYGVEVTYMGSIGYPTLDPAMAPLQRCKKLICLAQPAHTDAIEFEDGKIITSKLSSLDAITWENIQSCLSLEELTALLQSSDLIAFSNWSMILAMNTIWKQFLDQIAPQLTCQGKIAFFDLADPEKRTREDLLEALALIQSFSRMAFSVILSTNLKEACELAEALGLTVPNYHSVQIETLTQYLENHLEIDYLVIHRVDKAGCLHAHIFDEVRGAYCSRPVLTTGAGDNFNAGFLYGILQGFPVPQSLLLGCATSGYYVRNAASPTKSELISFLAKWEKNRLDE